MKTLQRFKIVSLFIIVSVMLTLSANLNAQTPQYYNYNTTGSSNSFPFNISAGKQIQLLYLPGDFNQPTPAPAGSITSVSFLMYANLGPYTYTNLIIKMGQTTATTFSGSGWYTGQLDTVYNRASVSLSGTAGGWLTIVLDRPFVYDPTQSLIVDVQQCSASGASGYSSCYTTISGNRRNTSSTTSACPFAWGNTGSFVHHFGITVSTAPTFTLPDLIYYKFKNNPSPTLTPNYAVPGVGTNPAPLTTLTMTSGGQFDSCLSGVATASAKIMTGYNLSTGTSSFTISMWLNNLVTPASTRYLFGDVGLSFRCFVGGVAPTGGAVLRGTGVIDVPINNIFPGPTVVHIVYDSALSNVKVYKNGILDNTVAQTLFNFTTGTGFSVGGYSSSAGLEGLMDEFRLYKRALGQAEITATWNQDIGGVITGVTPISTLIPKEYILSQNYPNPFNPVTKINYALPKSGFVTMKVYDMLGREVVNLVNENKIAGNYSIDFNASSLTSGVYFYRLEVNGFVDTKKMMLVK